MESELMNIIIYRKRNFTIPPDVHKWSKRMAKTKIHHEKIWSC